MTYVAHEETHNGMAIEIAHDECAYSYLPHSENEGLAPMLVYTDHGTTPYGADDSQFDPLDYASDVQIMLAAHDILELFGIDKDEWFSELVELRDTNRHPFAMPSDFADLMKDTLHYQNDGEVLPPATDRNDTDLEATAALFRILGIPSQVFRQNGYSQGDWAYVLVAHLPDWAKNTGIRGYDLTSKDPKENGQDDMQSDSQYWACWAWGDVYYISVTDPKDDKREPECVGGYYAAYGTPAWDAMISDAREIADSMADKNSTLLIAA